MIPNEQNSKEIQSLSWHDALVDCFQVNGKKIHLCVVFSDATREIILEASSELVVNFEEDWGPSKSIYEVTFKESLMKILMQSGISILIVGFTVLECKISEVKEL